MTPTVYRYRCPSCGVLSNSIRCPQCGNTTDELEDPETGYTIFSHAQLGHCQGVSARHCDDTRNLLHRQSGKANKRRFTGEPITGFDDHGI